MIGSDLTMGVLFLTGILVSFVADLRLRRAKTTSWSGGFLTVAGAGLVLFASAAAIG